MSASKCSIVDVVLHGSACPNDDVYGILDMEKKALEGTDRMLNETTTPALW
jgi:hypothetical protein